MSSRKGCKPDTEMREKVKAMWKSGMNFSEIGRALDPPRTAWAVNSMLRRMGAHPCKENSGGAK